MTDEQDRRLEAGLKGLSWWEGPTPGLWEKALAEVGQGEAETPSRVQRIVRSRWSWVGAPIAAVILAGLVLPWGFGTGATGETPSSELKTAMSLQYSASDGVANKDWYLKTPPIQISTDEVTDLASLPKSNDDVANSRWNRAYAYSLALDVNKTEPADRHVIRKAGVDLRTSDVRGVYLKVRNMVVNAGAGEFIEGAEIHGDSENASGYVTLRVAQDRLGAVLEQIREMAQVVREQTDSTDVTETVVDLAARLRNERRVEEELLELMASRDDAPLKEVLELREQLSKVRGEIERLAGQSQRLGKQVAMATVVVTIHHQAAKPEPKESSLLEYFQETMTGAWYDGVGGLIGSVAKVMRIVIGGAVWWIVLGGLGLAGRRWFLRWREAQMLAA
jgi:hypothetical protein